LFLEATYVQREDWDDDVVEEVCRSFVGGLAFGTEGVGDAFECDGGSFE